MRWGSACRTESKKRVSTSARGSSWDMAGEAKSENEGEIKTSAVLCISRQPNVALRPYTLHFETGSDYVYSHSIKLSNDGYEPGKSLSVTVMPRTQKPTKQRHDPLLTQLDDDELHAKYGHVSQPGKRRKSRGRAEDDTDEVLHLLCDGVRSRLSVRSFSIQKLPEKFSSLPAISKKSSRCPTMTAAMMTTQQTHAICDPKCVQQMTYLTKVTTTMSRK